MCDHQSSILSCGIGGKCVELIGNVSSRLAAGIICVCENKRWVQTEEFAFHLNDASEISTLPCDTEETIIASLYGAACFFGFVALVMTLILLYYHDSYSRYRVNTKRRSDIIKNRFMNYAPGVFLSSLIISSTMIRVVDRNRLFGHDFLFTTLFMICFSISIFTGMKHHLIFVKHVAKTFPFLELTFGERIRRAGKLNFFKNFIAYVMFVLGVILPSSKFRFTSLVLFRTIVALFVINQILVFVLSTYLFVYLEKEINLMIRGRKENVVLDPDVKIQLRRLLPQCARSKRIMFVYSVTTITLVLPTLFLDSYSSAWKYFAPLLECWWGLVMVIVMKRKVTIIYYKNRKFASIVDVKDLLE